MNPLHSPRNEHSKTEFGKKNSEKKFGESKTFSEGPEGSSVKKLSP